ncbi:MAG: hypothetical protein QOJ27_2112 [Sphingomonadales bacterium]|nr:hypothetical protein [Sphingomonadales bacterium]
MNALPSPRPVRVIPAESIARGARGTELPRRPYPGLRPFRLEEWPLFFGREVMVDEVIGRLLKRDVVVVHGSSGCGKSSLIYAGVLPQVARRASRGKRRLCIAEMRPGQAPLRTLATALAKACGDSDVDAFHRIVGMGTAGAGALRERLDRSGCRICLFVDQFEELFRFARHGSAAEAELFVQFLVGLAGTDPSSQHWMEEEEGEEEEAEAEAEEEALERKAHPIPAATNGGLLRLIVTMRSEFLGECARYPGLSEMINHTQYLLPAMTRADLIRAVREPAELFGAEVEHDLANRLVDEAVAEADPLPLMQHALMRLWSEGEGAMTLPRFEALAPPDPEDRGSRTGLGRLLASHANEALTDAAGMDDPVAELLFRALTDIDAEGRGIRRPQKLRHLRALVDSSGHSQLLKIIDAFRSDDASFLRPFESENEGPLDDDEVIDISHEALLRAWPRIADAALEADTGKPYGWLYREFEDGLIWRALAVQARLFRTDKTACLDSATTDRRDPWYDSLGSRAAWAERHLIDRGDCPPEKEPEWLAVRELMEASRQERRRERRRRLMRRAVLGAMALSLIASLLFIDLWVVQSRKNLEQSLKETEEQDQQQAEAFRARASVIGPGAAAPTPTARPAAAGLSDGVVWLGTERDPKLKDPVTGQPVPPSQLRVGTIYEAIPAWLVARATAPAPGYQLGTPKGIIPERGKVEIAAKPVAYRHNGEDHFWAPVHSQATGFGTVFIQFYGGGDEETWDPIGAEAESRRRAKAIAAELQHFGYKVPPTDREPGAAGLVEIRYFNEGDVNRAAVLASSLSKTLKKLPELVGLGQPSLRPVIGLPRKPPPGTLEIWIDVSPKPAPVEQTPPPAE